MRLNNQGFSYLLILAVIIVVVVSFAGYRVYTAEDTKTVTENTALENSTNSEDQITKYSNNYFSFYFPASLALANYGSTNSITVTGFHDQNALVLRFMRATQPDFEQPMCAGSNEDTGEAWTCSVSDIIPINNIHYPDAKVVFAMQEDTTSSSRFSAFYLSNDPDVTVGSNDFKNGIVLDNSNVLIAELGAYTEFDINNDYWGDTGKGFLESFKDSADYKELLHVIESIEIEEIYKT